ncbi:hypothetical protein EXIGLDRAFT_736452 [Exidia glandulosa HHB12029]|uniref:Uncharacterized protein n=1 Tax=Exidia glandulosa HHB12029 TaxID=1314781 RepID=A0A165JDX4_EXIGL|nr:hypothetical protein EXIGLDRAFT_736452 [Exidia glandulosa HHB12029]
MALLLNRVFETNNPWAVAGLAALLMLLGTTEVVLNKSKRRYTHMYPGTLVSLAVSTIPISVLGTRFAMSIDPFWKPSQYIPILGMLSGSAISGVVVAVTSVLRELQENRDKVEFLLAFGATRIEACRGVATEALRLALLPVINQMSVIGLIAIPGMMTGAILGGSSVEQAARLQMVIMFMISASTALAAMTSIVIALLIVVDGEHRIRDERVHAEKHAVWRARDAVVSHISALVSCRRA